MPSPRLAACLLVLLPVLSQPSEAAPPPVAPCAGEGVVFVANGAGDLPALSDNLSTAIAEQSLALRVERIDWSHGWYLPWLDLIDHPNHICHGASLAAAVLHQRETNPGAPIYLVGHSAGAMVILAAAERLPADCVDRIILLAPAVSASYDLRPALRCARDGVDSFYSKRDHVLSTSVMILGCADRRWEIAGGWLKFDLLLECGEEELAGKPRQHGWGLEHCHTGYLGGHYGCTNLGHVRERVVPLLVTSRPPAAPVAVADKGRPNAALKQTGLRRVVKEKEPEAPFPAVERPALGVPGRSSLECGYETQPVPNKGECKVLGFEHQRAR